MARGTGFYDASWGTPQQGDRRLTGDTREEWNGTSWTPTDPMYKTPTTPIRGVISREGRANISYEYDPATKNYYAGYGDNYTARGGSPYNFYAGDLDTLNKNIDSHYANQATTANNQPTTLNTGSTPGTNNNSAYDAAANLAKNTQTNDMGQTTSLGAVNNQINKAANTLSAPKYQSPDYVAQATGSIMKTMQPQLSQQNAATNQQFNNSAQKLAEQLAANGMNRGGNATRQTMALEQGRNTQLAGNYGNALSQAMSQAIQQGQLGLSEAGMMQNQQQTAASQLAALLGMQESSRQWSTGFNADQQQRQIGNQLTIDQMMGTHNGQQTLSAQDLAARISQQNIANDLTRAGLTGKVQTGTNADGTPIYSNTMASDPNSMANRLAVAELLGTLDGKDTLDKTRITNQNSQFLKELDQDKTIAILAQIFGLTGQNAQATGTAIDVPGMTAWLTKYLQKLNNA